MKTSLAKLPTLSDIQREKAERRLSEYIKQSWPIIEPGMDYMHNWHIDAISEHLEAVTNGEIRRLLINMPPRYMKSIAVTVDWPTWMWTKQPTKRFISLSYSQMLSIKHNIDRRNIIESPWYQSNWGDRFMLTGDQNTKIKFQNDHMGFMFSTSIGGTLTGEGSDFIIVDDPHNPKMAESEAERTTATEFFKTTLPSRLNDKKRGAIIVVMQRLHEQDVSGFVLEQGGYTHLCLPAEAEMRTVIHFPISGKQLIREQGELLWPEREGPKEIADMKLAMGSYGYSGQYQQDPSPSEGGMFKRQWWRYWHPKGMELPPVQVKVGGSFIYVQSEELPQNFDEQLQSWDCAFKDSDGSDFVAGQAWGRKRANKYLLERVNDRMDIVRTMDEILQLTLRYPKARLKLVEDKANGPAVIQMLKRKVSGMVAVNPEGGKVTRASAVIPDIEAGNVYLPHPLIAPWVEAFINTFAGFPKVAHDDDVDALSQALNRLMYNTSAQEEYDQEYESEPAFGRTGY